MVASTVSAPIQLICTTAPACVADNSAYLPRLVRGISRLRGQAAERRRVDKQAGFTLIEIIIVIFIIGLIVMTVTVNFAPRFGLSTQATESAHRLQQTLGLLQDQAIFRNQQTGVRIQNNELVFYYWYQNSWRAMTRDKFIRVKKLDPRLHLRVFTNTPQTNSASPQIIYYATGEATPFSLEIFDNQSKPYYRLQSDAQGHIDVTDLGRIE